MTPPDSTRKQTPDEYWLSRIEKPESQKLALDRIAADMHTIKNIAVFYLVLTLLGILAGLLVFAASR